MSSFMLKLIAILTMTVDHTAKTVLRQTVLLRGMTAIGRMAFPLYAFMIAEGCRKTRSMPRYLKRLALFAFISEPFFYFVFNPFPDKTWATFLDNLLHTNFTNIFFTLFLGAAAVYCCRQLEKAVNKRSLDRRYLLLSLPITAIFLLMSEYFDTDYGMAGVLLIVTLYFFPTKPLSALTITLWSIALYFGNIYYILGASLASLPILLYNGKRGPQLKWIFYVYYPVHLAVLYLLTHIML